MGQIITPPVDITSDNAAVAAAQLAADQAAVLAAAANIANGKVILGQTGTRFLLPKTGQTTEYQAGDDGTYQKGFAGTRFTDNGDGTVTDNATGLTWVKQPELIIPGAVDVHATNQIQVAHGNWAALHDYTAADVIFDAVGGVKFYVCAVTHTSGAVSLALDIIANPTYWRETIWTASAADLLTPAVMLWADAITACEALTYAGFTDWRLPNRFELESIINHEVNTPAAYAAFPNTKSLVYASSSTFNISTGQLWGVKFQTGICSYYDKESEYCYVRPVRGG